MSQIFESFTAFLNDPPWWGVVLIVMAAAWLINAGRNSFWSFILAVALCGFLWVASAAVIATFTMGWLSVLIWLAVALFLLYNSGWAVENEQYTMLTIDLLFLLALATMMGTYLFAIPAWMGVGVGFGALAVYLGSGFLVMRWKWVSKNEERFAENKASAANFLESLVKLLREQRRLAGQKQRADQGYVMTPPSHLSRSATPLTEAEIAIVEALPAERRALEEFKIPAALNDRWQEYKEVHHVYRLGIMENKARILAWIVAWPAIFVHLVLADLVKRLWTRFLNRISAMLLAAQRRIYGP